MIPVLSASAAILCVLFLNSRVWVERRLKKKIQHDQSVCLELWKKIISDYPFTRLLLKKKANELDWNEADTHREWTIESAEYIENVQKINRNHAI